MSEYDLKKSEKIGQLYPVLVDAKGNVIDGFHRLKADPNWKTEKIDEVDSEEKLLIARAVANWHRRQVSGEEKEEWINRLAEIYKKQGLGIGISGSDRNEILHKLVEVTGLSEKTVKWYLQDEYKQKRKTSREPTYRKPASEAIRGHFVGKDKDYGERLVERHREEVEQELRPQIEREVREELTRDVEFIRETIEKAPEVFPTLPKKAIERAKRLIEPKEMVVKEGTVYTVGEYECPHCKRHYVIKCNGKKDWVE